MNMFKKMITCSNLKQNKKRKVYRRELVEEITKLPVMKSTRRNGTMKEWTEYLVKDALSSTNKNK